VGAQEPPRQLARELARAALARGEPLAWFEELYARGEPALVPWAELAPNPNLLEWVRRERLTGDGRRALVVGAGLGDDAEALAALGFAVDAFDVSASAVAAARTRFPASAVTYLRADLLALPPGCAGAYDFVLEAYTLQVLPPPLRDPAAAAIAAALAPGGELLVITRGRDEGEAEGAMPWPLTPRELGALFDGRLLPVGCDDYLDGEEPPVRRLRATYRRPVAEPPGGADEFPGRGSSTGTVGGPRGGAMRSVQEPAERRSQAGRPERGEGGRRRRRAAGGEIPSPAGRRRSVA
jgi:SAM-dependent methyltransferase